MLLDLVGHLLLLLIACLLSCSLNLLNFSLKVLSELSQFLVVDLVSFMQFLLEVRVLQRLLLLNSL